MAAHDDAAAPAGAGVDLPTGLLLRPMTVWDIPEVLMHEHALFRGDLKAVQVESE